MFLIASISLGLTLLSTTMTAQSNPTSNTELENTVNSSSEIRISYALGFVSVAVGSKNKFEETYEGSQVLVGDLVKTVKGSAVRIIFPDGTAQTVCSNETYKVQEAGLESLPDGKESSEAATIAFSLCGIKPRYINKRCFFGLNNPLPKADKDSGSKESSDLSRSSCTLGESLFSRFQGNPTPPSVPQTPAPSGGSPVR